MDYIFVNSNQGLLEVCNKASMQPAVALDTEFVRTKTLTPQLGLLQLFDGEQLVLIDPLAIENMQPFIDLLLDKQTVKVLHSCSEDLEALLTRFSVVPSPLFDTQFAANLVGLGATMGYARMIESLLEVTLEKGESRTDWLARPLTENQCRYAADDVLYLLPAYERLRKQIEEQQQLDWVFSESAMLADKKRAYMPEDFAYMQIKNAWRLSSEKLFVLQALAAWRLGLARTKDSALNFVFRESHLYDIANSLPKSRNELNQIHSITPQEKRIHGDTVLNLVSNALQDYSLLSDSDKLPRIKRLIDVPEYKLTMSNVKQIVEDVAKQQGTTAEIIASKKQINQVLKWYWFEQDETKVLGLTPDLLNGWRGELLKEQLHQLFNNS